MLTPEGAIEARQSSSSTNLTARQLSSGPDSKHITRQSSQGPEPIPPEEQMLPPEGATTASEGASEQFFATRRTTRTITPPQRLIETMTATTAEDQEPFEILSLQAMFPVEEEEFHAFKATLDPDTMYLHQAMREPDKRNL